MENITKRLNPLKLGAYFVTAVMVLLLALNSFTVTSAGTTKVGTLMGKVHPVPYTEGVHLVNPLMDFDVFDTRNSRYEVNGLNLPTQDRFNSLANVTVLYRIEGTRTPWIKQEYGTAEQYIDKTLRQQLRSVIRDEARKLEDSRALAQSDKVSLLQLNTTNRLKSLMASTGIDIQEVLVQDIEFDPRIAKQILATQQQIQREEEKKSQERVAATEAEIKKQEAIGDAYRAKERADALAYRLTTEANAKKAAFIAEAEGKAQSIILIADANLKLSKSLTPEVLRKQELDNEAILFSKATGKVPHTIIGDTNLRAIGVPVATGK